MSMANCNSLIARWGLVWPAGMGRCNLIVPPVGDKPQARRPLTLAELRLLADACIDEWPMLLRYYSERQILESWQRLAETHQLTVEGASERRRS